MVFRATFLTLILLVTGCASTSVESPAKIPPSVPHNSVFADSIRPSDHHPQLREDVGEPQYQDIWDRVRDGFGMESLDNKFVAEYEKWYAARPKYITRVVERAYPYLHYIVEEIEKRGMPTELVLLPAIESAFVPTAYSRAHAVGLWQFIPATARRYDIKINWWYDGRRDVIASTRAALDYLQFLHEEFNGNWFYALAAYNAGEGSIAYAIKKNKSKGRDTRYTNLRLKSETRRYVPKLIALKNIINDPARYGITLDPVPNEPYFATVDTGGQIDLNVVRELSGLNPKEMRHLNAAFKRWSTDPDGPHRLLVPLDMAPSLEIALDSLPESARVKWGSYSIREGDTLGQIAQRHGISVSALQRSNRLNGTLIRAGKTLLIPMSSGVPQEVAFVSSGAQQESLVHQVRSGDTLWGIARRYNVYISQLTKWNSIRTDEALMPGQSIVVYIN